MQQAHRSARWLLRFVLAVSLTAAPIGAQALGLGRLVVNSGLDEPLNGQIELVSPTSAEIKSLKTTLASRQDFDIAGVERNALLFDITYSVIQHSNGQYFIKLATHKPVREPFVHFLIQVEWNGGRLIREYSALLDPPQWVAGRPADINAPSAAPEPAQPALTPETEALPVAEIPAMAEAPPPEEETLPPIGTDPAETVAIDQSQTDAGQSAAAPPAPVAEVAVAPTATPEPAAEIEAIPPPVDMTGTEPTTTLSPEPAPELSSAPFERAPTAVADSAPISASQYGPVKKGETLTQIAKNLNVDKSLTSQQIMLALLRANPAAFFGQNVNNLKVGKILNVPEQETIAAVSPAQAAKDYSAQYDAWQEYKLKMAGATRAVAVAEPEAVAPAAEQPKKSEPKKADKVAKAAKPSKPEASSKAVPTDLLKIVRSNLEQEQAEESTKTPGVETKKDAAKEQRVLNERVATLEEAIESKQLQNKEMRERVGKLQEQVKNTERLVDLENKEMAVAQKQAAEKQAAEKQVAEAKAALEQAQERAIQEKALQEKALQEKAAQDKVAQEKAADAAAQAAKPAEAKPAETAPVKKPATTPKPIPAPMPVEESFLDGIITSISDNPLTLSLLAVLGVLALGVAGMYAYRRRQASREFSESILSSNSLSGEASLTDNSSSQAAASDTSFLSDFSQGGMGNIHTDEVDPIAEAEVYLAYGRDEQAEEILKDAIVKDPVRQELKGKLLEIYFQRNDVAAFETLAEELYAALEGKGSKVWEKAEEMGRKLSPTNPLFRGGKPSVRTAAAATTLLADKNETNNMLSTQSMEFEPQAPAAPVGLDFNLDFDSKPVQAPEPASLDMTFDMDFPNETPATRQTSGLDMDFNLGTPAPDTSNLIDFNVSNNEDNSNALDFSASERNTVVENDIDFSSPSDIGDDAADGNLPGWDETATKLDLAKAYIDMGDSEGARSILDEVMAEGNDNQKRQAQDLASQIAA